MKIKAPKLTPQQKAKILGDSPTVQLAFLRLRQGWGYDRIAKCLNSQRKSLRGKGRTQQN
jgi:hypothetical protein